MRPPVKAPVRFKTDPEARPPGVQLTLFPNVIPEGRFGIVAPFADRFKALADEITPESAAADYAASSRTGRAPIFTAKGKGKTGQDTWALQLTGAGRPSQPIPIDTPDQAYSEIEKLRSPAVVKGVLTLWNCANERQSFSFRGTRLNDIMRAGGYKPSSTGYYTQDQKREFTDTLYTLQNWRIYIDRDTKDTDDSGHRRDMVERRFFSLLEIERAIYAKRRDGTTDDSVIVRLYGELLPRLNKALERGRPYPKTLLTLDARRDGGALLLGFKLSTRIDQLRQSNRAEPLALNWTLEKLITFAGRANDYPHLKERIRRYRIRRALAKDLAKLVAVGCIAGFDPERLPTDELDRVTIYAPSLALPAAGPSSSEVTTSSSEVTISSSEVTISSPRVTLSSSEVTPDDPPEDPPEAPQISSSEVTD